MGEHVVVTAGATRHTACGRLPLRGCVLAARAARPAWPVSSMASCMSGMTPLSMRPDVIAFARPNAHDVGRRVTVRLALVLCVTHSKIASVRRAKPARPQPTAPPAAAGGSGISTRPAVLVLRARAAYRRPAGHTTSTTSRISVSRPLLNSLTGGWFTTEAENPPSRALLASPSRAWRTAPTVRRVPYVDTAQGTWAP